MPAHLEELAEERPIDTLVAMARERSFTVAQAFTLIEEWRRVFTRETGNRA